MEARAATRTDLAKIFRNLAVRMTAEYKKAGFSVIQAKQVFTANVTHGRAHALVEDGEVLAVIAWEVRDGAAHTSFAATEEFFQRRFMAWFGDHLRQVQFLVGGLELRSASYSDLPSVPGWFKRLGFRDPFLEGSSMVYVLPAPGAEDQNV